MKLKCDECGRAHKKNVSCWTHLTRLFKDERITRKHAERDKAAMWVELKHITNAFCGVFYATDKEAGKAAYEKAIADMAKLFWVGKNEK